MNRFNPFFLMAFFVLAGCATKAPLAPLEDARFEISGKLGVRWADERFSARFRWRQEASAYDIELWGPLGQGRTFLAGDDRLMEVRNGGGELLDVGPVREVMLRHLGWYLPLAAMPRWISGRPLAGQPLHAVERAVEGHITGFTQLDWRLQFDRFSDGRPRRITAQRDEYWIRVVL